MPPRTRTVKSTKVLKENIGITAKSKRKPAAKVVDAPRKVLGDKTNSASDDNASLENPYKPSKKLPTEPKLTKSQQSNDNIARPRRDRRFPGRFVQNRILKNLSNSNENADVTSNTKKIEIFKTKDVTPIISSNDTVSSTNNDSKTVSPFKTPQKIAEISLVSTRPRRVSRLPSRFEDHSVSPSKFIPVQPCHSSTPLALKHPKTCEKITQDVFENNNNEDKTSRKIQVEPNSITKVIKKQTNVLPCVTIEPKKRIMRTRKIANGDNESPVTKRSPVKVSPQKKSPIKKPKSPVKGVKTPVKSGKNLVKGAKVPELKVPIKGAKTPEKGRKGKGVKTPVKEVKTPLKKVTLSPVFHSYLSSVKKDTSHRVQSVKDPVKPTKRTNTKPLRKDLSFKVLEENKRNQSNQDIYEFTFDPNEEPAPQKKKRKAVKRKPASTKPKTVVFKCNYDQNVNKALKALRNVVGKKPTQTPVDKNALKQQDKLVEAYKDVVKTTNHQIDGTQVKAVPQVQRDVASKIIIGTTKQSHTNNVENVPQIQENILLNVNQVQSNVTTNVIHIPEPNQSIRVEDIAADFESSPQHDIDYSPVNSPLRPKTPDAQISVISDIHHNDDPLNLRENISFDINPIASSSMNTSVRHPHASPWRIEFESLPIRWHVSSYVKPNMTPAVECSFVNFDDKNKKKHVYTDLVPESNEELPDTAHKEESNLVQTSMISFIKEMVEKSSSKKNRRRSATPVTASLFNDVSNKTPNKDDENVKKTTRQLFTPKKNTDKARSDTSNTDSSNNISENKENSKESTRGQKRKNNENFNSGPAKTPRKETDDKYFGFDDSENLENVSPHKNIGRKRSVRQARARAVLREINNQAGPTRAALPVAIRTAQEAEVERLYDEMKSATDAPKVPAKEIISAAAKNVIEPVEELCEDSQTSVHLFEDIDFVHHLKPHRKSYGKAKKVTFIRQASTDTQDSDLRPEKNCSDAESDLNDLTFDPGMPFVEEDKKRTKKKQSKRQKFTKKEEEEAEAWAAGFNSMCEDVEEFPLVVE